MFKKVDDKYYFLILFSPEIKNWILGKPFLKKYQISFNSNSNEAIFYINNKENKSKSKAWLVILLIFIVIIIIVVLLFVIKRYKNNKKQITNEDIDVKGNLLTS